MAIKSWCNWLLRQRPHIKLCTRHQILALLSLALLLYMIQPDVPVTQDPDPILLGHSLTNGNFVPKPAEPSKPNEIAVVLLAAQRPEVHQLIYQLVALKPQSGFRILVSMDGDEKQTMGVLRLIESAEVTLLHLSSDSTSGSGANYAKIARHYKRVLDHVLLELNFAHVILLEDDLLIAPDFFQYFSSLRRALDSDESIFCVSAWNDNGQLGLVTEDPQLLHRTDFFPGLGWMINQRSWQRVRTLWPKDQYDDFLRRYMLKNDLVCLRPELSRTFNIGRSGGQSGGYSNYYSKFYHNYLSKIMLNRFNVSLSQSAVSRVIGRSADLDLDKHARSLPVMNVSHLLSVRKPPPEARLRYGTAREFMDLAQSIGAIPEVWFGAPRASILGISVISLRGSRVYIVPDKRLPINDRVLVPKSWLWPIV